MKIGASYVIMYWLYILQLNDGSYYIGSTGNLKKRLEYHKGGRVQSTKYKLPALLLYKEEFASRSEARKRELQIKSWKSRKAIERLINNGPVV